MDRWMHMIIPLPFKIKNYNNFVNIKITKILYVLPMRYMDHSSNADWALYPDDNNDVDSKNFYKVVWIHCNDHAKNRHTETISVVYWCRKIPYGFAHVKFNCSQNFWSHQIIIRPERIAPLRLIFAAFSYIIHKIWHWFCARYLQNENRWISIDIWLL